MSHIERVYTRQASVADIELLTPLFDAYRVFYGKPSDSAVARAFLLNRLQHNESVLFVALQAGGAAIGFVQLYPIFSSVSAARSFVLNDLYVIPDARRSKVGVKLLEAAVAYGRAVGAINLSLSTAIGNETAQALYVSQGWVRDTEFYAYSLLL